MPRAMEGQRPAKRPFENARKHRASEEDRSVGVFQAGWPAIEAEA